MREHLPWFSQGDVLTSVPVISVDLDGTGSVSTRQVVGPALLLTHGCVLDKATRSGRSTIKRLQFVPLISVGQQEPHRQQVLRNDGLTPYEVLYLGDCGSYGESFVVLSEIFSLPAAVFDVELKDWAGHAAATAGERYLTPRRNAERIGRLDVPRLELLAYKLIAFWTRRLPKEAELIT